VRSFFIGSLQCCNEWLDKSEALRREEVVCHPNKPKPGLLGTPVWEIAGIAEIGKAKTYR